MENTDCCRARGGECGRQRRKQEDTGTEVKMLWTEAGEAGSPEEKWFHKPWPSTAKHKI